MSTLKDKVKEWLDQQEVIRETEKKLKIDQVLYEAKMQEVLRELGFNEKDHVPLADLVKRAMEKVAKG